MLSRFPLVSKLVMSSFVLAASNVGAHAQEVLLPPFGLQWGGDPEKLLEWVSEQELQATTMASGSDPKIKTIRVESTSGSLPNDEAHALDARYHDGKLFEVLVHHGLTHIDSKYTVNYFNELKSSLAVKYGMFSPNNKQQNKIGGRVRKSVAYHVEPVSGLLLMLVLSELKDVDSGKHSARFSLIYRNQNIILKG
ncbi:MAG: hypothetical protein ACPIA7_02050 [Akkermansiaceae bacterium]